MNTTSSRDAARLSKFDRLILISGFIATTLVTSAIGFVSQDRSAECQLVRSQRVADVERYRSVASDFEPLIRVYFGDLAKDVETASSRRKVVDNLVQQRAKLQYVVPHLDVAGKESARRLDTAITNFILEADKNPDFVEAGQLYQELAYILENNQSLVAATNRATGLAGIDVMTGRFWRRTFNCAEA